MRNGMRIALAGGTGMVALAAVLTVVVGYSGRSRDHSVDAIRVQAGVLAQTVTANGVVAALEAVDVKYALQDRVERVFVREGDAVRRGQAVAQMDARLLEPQLRQARAVLARTEVQLAQARTVLAQASALFEGRDEAALPGELTPVQAAVARTRVQATHAERQWHRLATLATAGYLARADAESAEATWRALAHQRRADEAAALNETDSAAATVRALQAQRETDLAGIALAEEQLARARIQAPIDGVVISLLVSEGELLGSSQAARSSGKPNNVLMTLVNPASIVVFADVQAVDVQLVAPRQPAVVRPTGARGPADGSGSSHRRRTHRGEQHRPLPHHRGAGGPTARSAPRPPGGG
jgi:multidrug resistance efflux pump